MIVSHDDSRWKSSVIKDIAMQHKLLEIFFISNMKYEDYKDVVGHSKFSLTFGEGLDNYFIEMAFSGGIPFAVYNERVFLPEFKNLPNVFRDWAQLSDELPVLLKNLEADQDLFLKMSNDTKAVLKNIYSRDRYIEKMRKFYDRELQFQ